MNNSNAFTLIELLVVMAIMGILMTIGTLNFSYYITKGKVEGQTKELYSDLMSARTQALTKQRANRVVISATQFQMYSSQDPGALLFTKTLKYGVTWAGGGTSKTIDFDERGLFSVVSNSNTSICVNGSVGDSAVYNSVVVFSTRMHMGKLNVGGSCASDNIDVK